MKLMQLVKYIIGTISIIMMLVGLILKRLSEPGAEIGVIGAIIFIFGFTYTLIHTLANQSRQKLRQSTIILFITIEFAMLGIVTGRFHLPGRIYFEIAAIILLGIFWVFFSGAVEGRKLQLRKNRQLAAILFTDIVGFTKMMGEEEDSTLRMLDQNREIQKKIIKKYRGKWIKELGDGTLVIFYTVTEAVLASIDIQKEIKKLTSFNVRMGIHISEILFTDTDVFGDGVNVAARIANLAGEQEIYISEGVFHNIKNRENLTIESKGEISLKNVTYPVRIYKIKV